MVTFDSMRLEVYILSLVVILFSVENYAQTCCSGGVPLTGNLGMPSANIGSWQFSLSYDRNHLSTLREGLETVEDNSRKRQTQSILLESSYSLTDRLSISGLITYVFQDRVVAGFDGITIDKTRGTGDGVLLINYRLLGSSNQNWEILFGAGPKIPIGRSDLKSPAGITYNADLQPGSGAWDAVAWGLVSKQGFLRPSTNLSLRFIYRYTGTNNEYQGTSTYRFGNELQIISGISDQILLGSRIIDPSILLRFRKANTDMSGNFSLPNTGGKWIFLIPGIVYHHTPRIHFRIAGEIPVYSYLEGIQLSTDFRFTAGVYVKLTGKRSKSPGFYL